MSNETATPEAATDPAGRAMSELLSCEREELQKEHRLNSLGDRPHCMAAHKLKRMIELEIKAGI